MGNWVVDLAHSTVGFEVKHMMVSKVRGKFDRFEAKVIAEDLADLENATIEFTFDVNSINTGNNERDHHLKSVDFFDVINYPTIEFQSTSIKKYEDNYKVTGQLTIKGITKLVTFDVVYGGKATAPWGTEIYGYEAFATINREEFGLVWNAALETGGLLIGQEIKIKAELEISEEGYDFSEKNWNEHQIESGNINLEQKEMKNELHRLIAENLTDIVAIINRKGNIHYVTPSF